MAFVIILHFKTNRQTNPTATKGRPAARLPSRHSLALSPPGRGRNAAIRAPELLQSSLSSRPAGDRAGSSGVPQHGCWPDGHRVLSTVCCLGRGSAWGKGSPARCRAGGAACAGLAGQLPAAPRRARGPLLQRFLVGLLQHGIAEAFVSKKTLGFVGAVLGADVKIPPDRGSGASRTRRLFPGGVATSWGLELLPDPTLAPGSLLPSNCGSVSRACCPAFTAG